MQIFIGVPVKWLVRFGLFCFYVVGIALQIGGTNFFGWLIRDHIHWTVFLIFLTIITFVSPFFHIKKKTADGGEKELRKLAWFVIIVFAIVLAIAIGAAANDPFKQSVIATLTGILGPIYITISNGWSNVATQIGASGTYFLIYTVGILIAGGVLFVALVRIKNSGKLPSIRGTSSTVPASSGTLKSTTPAGATVRPANPESTSPTATLAEEELEKTGA